MRNIFLLISLLLFTVKISAQDILWEKSYGGKHAEYLLDAQPTADYGFILAGSSLSQKGGNKTEDNVGDLDYWVWKMDEHGEPDWQKNFGGTGTDMLYSIRNTRDGGFVLAGTSDSGEGSHKKEPARGKEDLWVLKLDAKGNEMWQCTIGGTGQEMIKSVAQTTDGGYILGGSSASCISQSILSGGSDKNGKNEKNRGNLDYWILKLDDKGEIKWQRTLGGMYVDILEVILQTKDGGYVVGGNSASETSGNKSKTNQKGTDFWIVRLDEYGDLLWQETYNTGETDILTSLVENRDRSFLIGGYAQTEILGKKKADAKDINDYIALKIDAEGKELWKESVGSKGEDILRKLVETRDGGYLLAGTSKGEVSRDRNSGQGKNDFWVVKLKDKKKKEEKRLKLEAIPNPAVEYTNIIVGFDFDTGTLSLFDLGGRQLQSFSVDSRTIPLQMGSYPEGIYIVEVRTNKGTESVKVMKAKN